MISQWLPAEETTVPDNGGSTILCLDSIKSFAAFAQPRKIGNYKTKNRRRSPPFPGLHCHTLTPRIYSSIYTILQPGKADFKQSSLRSRKTLKSLIYGISSLSFLFLQRLSPEGFFLLQRWNGVDPRCWKNSFHDESMDTSLKCLEAPSKSFLNKLTQVLFLT